MTSRPATQCAYCKHYRSPLDTGLGIQTCEAYPGGIPDEIWLMRVDHRRPQPGDQGVRWEPDDGAPYPERP